MLIVVESDRGNWCVRPSDWAGVYDTEGRICELESNHTAIFSNRYDADEYVRFKNSNEDDLK